MTPPRPSQGRESDPRFFVLEPGTASVGYVLCYFRYYHVYNERFPTLKAALATATHGEDYGEMSSVGIKRLRDGKVVTGKAWSRLLQLTGEKW